MGYSYTVNIAKLLIAVICQSNSTENTLKIKVKIEQ